MITHERIDENTRMATDGTRNWKVKRMNGVDLWGIEAEKGPLPKFLDGMYTDPTRAYDRLESYLALKIKA